LTSSATGRNGRLITFYSYKGGTGRSMALANVAWILASAKKRVLMVDWDLEAPGLHRYVHPFLADKYLTASPGVINMAHEYQTAVVKELSGKPQPFNPQPEWFAERADILRYATEVSYTFEGGGVLHFIPAGLQDATYAKLVNRFNWQQLFDNLGGYHFFEAVKQQMRAEYDYVLIDSRTGVSDTSGLCTVQLPDEVVVCFTMNTQSLEGASSVALSALQQRALPDGASLRIWPVPTRVELAEKERVDRARERARALFEPLLGHIKLDEREAYWTAVEVLYHPFYAYEEVLCVFGDQPGQTHSMLAAMERLTSYLTDRDVQRLEPVPESMRRSALASFSRRPASETNRILASYAAQYEEIRRTMQSGDERTRKMTELVFRVQALADQVDVRGIVELFGSGQDGARIVALALARAAPSAEFMTLALEGVREPRSPFEQYEALTLARALAESASGVERRQVLAAIRNQLGGYIRQTDSSRWLLAHDLMGMLTAGEPSGSVPAENEWIKFAPTPKPLREGDRWHVFLSYRSVHRSWVLSLYDVLRNLGYQVFLDQLVLRPTDTRALALTEALDTSQAAVIVLSSAENSEWLKREFLALQGRASADKEFRLVPIQLDRGPVPIFVASRAVLDFSEYPDGPNGGELLRLIYAVNGQPLSEEAARFAAEQDEAVRSARTRIAAAVRNDNPERLVQLYEQGGLVWQTSPVLGCKTVEGLIRLARYPEAISMLDRLENQFPKALRPKQLRALALNRRGELPEAQEILGELYEQGARDPETLSTYARTWLNRFAQSGDLNHLRQARDLYAEAYNADPHDYYLGINAASTSVLLGDSKVASEYAKRLEPLLGTTPQAGDYWKTAAAAELWLILENYERAAGLYNAAVGMARSEVGSHQATWTQACRLMAILKPDPNARDTIRAAFTHLPDCEFII
jgi:MinD-like ATPase involved in chromosome partitioning or flagellar assembly